MAAKSGRRAKKGRIFTLILLLIIIIAALGFFFTYSFLTKAREAYKPGDTTSISVTVPSGSSTKAVARILEEKGVVRSAKGFEIAARQEGYDGRFQAGEYELSASMDAHELMEALTKGHIFGETLRFTIPEGLTRRETAEKLKEQNILANVDDFLYLTSEHDGIEPNMSAMGDIAAYFASAPISGYKAAEYLEGFLMPNTYEIYAGSSIQDVIDTMLRQFGKVFTVDDVKMCEELGYTPYEVLIIASMVEKEAQTDEDRPLIASVIYNRLEKGQRLEIDATTLYALGENKGYVTTEDTKTASPYNTYQTDGLPPTPICSPGAAAIRAALEPTDTDYYYYVVSEALDGSHTFAKTYNEHLANVQKYRAALKAAGRSY